jgi:hypothetical protein
MTWSRKKFTTVGLNRRGMPKDQGWPDSCGVEGQERRGHVDKHSRSTQRRQFSGWTWKRNKASNCGRLQSPHGLCRQADRMANIYMASRRTRKWIKKLFFHLWDMAILNSCILLSTCGGKKISHRDFRLTLIREMLARARYEPRPFRAVGRPALASAKITRLDTRHNKHWSGRNPTRKRCRVCSERGVTRTVRSTCVKCDVALCVDRSCFTDYHTKDKL